MTMNTKAYIMYILGLALLLSAIFYINHASAQAGRFLQSGVVVIMPIINDDAHTFNVGIVRDLAQEYNGHIATERLNIMPISIHNQTTPIQTRMSTVDLNYFDMVHMQFISGGQWREGGEFAVIINDNLAHNLFGATDVVGLALRINDVMHTIVGVAESGRDDTVRAWISQGESLAGATTLYIKPSNYNPLTAFFDAHDLLYRLRLHHANFIITDINDFIDNIALRGQFLLILLAVIFIIASSRWAYRLFRLAVNRGTKGAYAIAAALTIAAILSVAFLLNSLSIDLWMSTFTSGTLPAQTANLPQHLAAVAEISERANVALRVSLAGVAVVVVTWFFAYSKHHRQ